MTRRRHSRQAIAAVAATVVLVTAFGGIAWALSVTKGTKVSVSASYTIRVALGENKTQRLFTVGDVTAATECTAWEDPGPGSGVFMVGGKALTLTNNGPDPVLVVMGEQGGTFVAPNPPVHTLVPGDQEAYGIVGGATTNNDPSLGGAESFAILDQGGRSASGSYSFWYDAPDGPITASSTGTCVITAQMHG